MKCETCGSDHTQRLEVVHDSGTLNTMAVSRTFTGTLGLGSTLTSTSGVTQSALARRAAPPERGGVLLYPVFTMIGVLLVNGGGLLWQLCGFVLIAASILAVALTIKHNRRHWPARYRRWLNGWMCQQCGHISYQDAPMHGSPTN